MKIFLAGGTGVVGRRALPALVSSGHDVTALARSDAKAEEVRALGGTPVLLDLFDRDAIAAAVTGHEVVVNLATSIPPLTKAALPGAWALNERIREEGSANLVDAALAAGAARYVQESIAFPYIDNGDMWIDEDHPVTHTKMFDGAGHAEANTARFADDGGVGVVLRFAQFYAPDAGHTRTFNDLVRRRINPFLGPSEGYVSFIHAEDAGAAAVTALDAPSGVFNVVDDEPLTRAEAGAVIAGILGVKPPRAVPKVVRAASPPSAKLLMRSQRVSHARFTAATGWAPAHRSIRGSWPVEEV